MAANFSSAVLLLLFFIFFLFFLFYLFYFILFFFLIAAASRPPGVHAETDDLAGSVLGSVRFGNMRTLTCCDHWASTISARVPCLIYWDAHPG